MGGVDLVDSQVAVYRPNVRKNKWWFSIFTTGVSIMCVNAWRLWNTLYPKVPYIDFWEKSVCLSCLSTKNQECTLGLSPLSVSTLVNWDLTGWITSLSKVQWKGFAKSVKSRAVGKGTRTKSGPITAVRSVMLLYTPIASRIITLITVESKLQQTS